eukprot:gnl/Dysnectes_brevis/619_a686_1866.p1 GENE.gnl/Dysnectes_brevis/619_a686_1866~~gnl/Dysnectes_brevis/619_a686_1866.p1  ORF type:complete len:418 (+),score=113.51 gnl/Dysnectes_brevis/619_a686_1866:559-1812(+)
MGDPIEYAQKWFVTRLSDGLSERVVDHQVLCTINGVEFLSNAPTGYSAAFKGPTGTQTRDASVLDIFVVCDVMRQTDPSTLRTKTSTLYVKFYKQACIARNIPYLSLLAFKPLVLFISGDLKGSLTNYAPRFVPSFTQRAKEQRGIQIDWDTASSPVWVSEAGDATAFISRITGCDSARDTDMEQAVHPLTEFPPHPPPAGTAPPPALSYARLSGPSPYAHLRPALEGLAARASRQPPSRVHTAWTILVPSPVLVGAPINLHNILPLLLDGQYLPSPPPIMQQIRELNLRHGDVCSRMGSSDLLVRRNQSTFRICASPPSLTSEQWQRVVLAVVTGDSYQLRTPANPWPHVGTLFARLQGVHFYLEQREPNRTARSWPVSCMAVSPLRAHLNMEAKREFWKRVDTSVSKISREIAKK